MLKYFVFAAALSSIGKAALSCDGAIVTDIYGNETETSAVVAGACTVSSTPNFTISLIHKCTEDDLIQYIYDSGDCSGMPIESTTVCTGPWASECDITCSGTPCDYVAITVEYGVTECDGTSAVDATTMVVQPQPLDYCAYDADYDESTEYVVELDGNIVYNTYDGEGCSTDPTFSSIQEDTCFVDFGGFAMSSTVATAEDTMAPPPETTGMMMPAELGCDGAVVWGEPVISGTCQAIGDMTSVMYACNSDGDDITMTGYNTSDCSGDSFATRELCATYNISDCAVTCDGIPCDVVTMMSYMNVTECNEDGTPVDGMVGYSESLPLDFCSYGSSLTSDDGVTVMVNEYDTDDCSGDPSTTEPLENMCDDTLGYAVVYSLEVAPTPMPTTPAPEGTAPEGTGGGDGEDGQSMIGSAVSVTFVCFVLSFLF